VNKHSPKTRERGEGKREEGRNKKMNNIPPTTKKDKKKSLIYELFYNISNHFRHTHTYIHT